MALADKKKSRLLLPAVIAVVLITIAIPKNAKFNYEYRKGVPWEYETLVAQIDFPVFKTEDQLKSERRNSGAATVPYYRFDGDILPKAIRELDSKTIPQQLREEIASSLTSLYSRGIVDGRPESEVLYLQKGKSAVKYPSSEFFELQDSDDILLATVNRRLTVPDLDSVFRQAGIYDLLVPNLIFDRATTDLISSGAENNVSPTSGFVSAGDVIVSSGEMVTAETAQILDSYKKEYEQSIGGTRSGFLQWTGSAIIAICLVLSLFLIIYFVCPFILKGWRRYSYLFAVFTIGALGAILVCRFEMQAIYFVPFTVLALFLQAFFENRQVVPVYAVTLLPLLLFSVDGAELYVMFFLAGIVAIVFFKRFGRGWRQFVTAFVTFIALAVIYLAFWMTEMATGSLIRNLLRLFVGSMMTVALYQFVYLFEIIFNLVSISRMEELCDTSNPILQELERKAPGSFQHSLQVMNMADAAARAIGANVPLVRVGAMYHDIGKICNPLCFVENESILAGSAGRYHSELTPLQSAKDIIRHVTDGETLARKHRLPVIIPEFIRCHHGTTTASYFYNKYLNEGGDPANIADFTYPGPKPSSKEQIILMLCDSIEAASRSLTDYSAESFDEFVERIVGGKLEAGQFEESDISIQDLAVIKSTLKNYLAQMYHGRIAYPREMKTNKIQLWKSKQTKKTH